MSFRRLQAVAAFCAVEAALLLAILMLTVGFELDLYRAVTLGACIGAPGGIVALVVALEVYDR